ncbi:MAG: hypothetical protein WCP18_02775 [bacterium]
MLKIIVEEHIDMAVPVSSALIVEKYFSDLSPATIRNEMCELEELGLICQPHTSAGRLPTLKGYEYYIKNFVKTNRTSNESPENFHNLAKNFNGNREDVKNLAKELAELSVEAILVGFGDSDVYYTGIANLFRQPEFFEPSRIFSLSDAIDNLDEAMHKTFQSIDIEPKIMTGKASPFGEATALIMVKLPIADGEIFLGILGPLRMNYNKNLGLISELKKIIK